MKRKTIVCLDCEYQLDAELPSPGKCPECGRDYDLSKRSTFGIGGAKPPRVNTLQAVCFGLIGGGLVSFAVISLGTLESGVLLGLTAAVGIWSGFVGNVWPALAYIALCLAALAGYSQMRVGQSGVFFVGTVLMVVSLALLGSAGVGAFLRRLQQSRTQ